MAIELKCPWVFDLTTKFDKQLSQFGGSRERLLEFYKNFGSDGVIYDGKKRWGLDSSTDSSDISYDDLNEGYTSIEDFSKGLTGIKNWTNDKLNTYDTGIKNWTNDQISTNTNDLKNWVSDNFFPKPESGSIDLSEYAKIADVNSAFESLATALGGL